jgi:hypothetical protein
MWRIDGIRSECDTVDRAASRGTYGRAAWEVREVTVSTAQLEQ